MTASAIAGAATAAPFFGTVNAKAKAATTGATTPPATDTNSLDASNLGTTFLNLLVQELQNQDPTQPMDPTAMVGQMISLNQLDQLISINTALTPTTSTGSTTPSANATGGSAALAQAAKTPSGGDSTVAALDPSQAAASLAGTQAAAASQASAADTNSPLNLGNLNTILGGK